MIVLALGLGAMGAGSLPAPGLAAEAQPLRPRVPLNERRSARQLVPPFVSTKTAPPEIIAEGQALYEGKGTCVSCHGETGLGDGPIGRRLNPGPRNFTNCKFHKTRKDGELFWIIKNGSPGTGMVPMIPVTITEEEAWKILAYERSFCKGWNRVRAVSSFSRRALSPAPDRALHKGEPEKFSQPEAKPFHETVEDGGELTPGGTVH